ncbi:hypothetical protein Tco_0681391 [Tanacetum coccineum]|uniref:Polyprotein n=1 Tax=Tanacetum coccineum TaxID=301880 RepID=A0ABQ4XNA7_9ASTR
MARNRHQVARTTRRVFGSNNYNRTLKTTVDPERQLEISRERRANLVLAEVLYSNNRSTTRHRVYEHYSEQIILCVGENQINLRLCNEESYESLRNSGLQHIHLEIFMIRLHALNQRSAGTNALVVLRDTRWEDSRQIIATMEVDLSAGTQLVYTFPDMILSVNDFHNHVEVAIHTHGYDTWQGGESNLLITMALTGRLSNTSYMGFQYSVENVVDHLTTTGITAIPGERRSIEELEGMSWHLKPPEQTLVRVPSRVAVNERLNRSHDREVIRNDNLDEDEEHFIGICLQTPQEEHISYDVCFCENCLNEARILEEEPLNKVRRSNKPKRSRQRSWERWSTLGEPSEKWDYYVKYDAPPDTTPIEKIAATAQFKKIGSENFECTPSVLIAGDFISVSGDKVALDYYGKRDISPLGNSLLSSRKMSQNKFVEPSETISLKFYIPSYIALLTWIRKCWLIKGCLELHIQDGRAFLYSSNDHLGSSKWNLKVTKKLARLLGTALAWRSCRDIRRFRGMTILDKATVIPPPVNVKGWRMLTASPINMPSDVIRYFPAPYPVRSTYQFGAPSNRGFCDSCLYTEIFGLLKRKLFVADSALQTFPASAP